MAEYSMSPPALTGGRSLFKLLSLGMPAFAGEGPAALAAAQHSQPRTPASIVAAHTLAGLEFTAAERQLMADGVAENLDRYQAIRALDIGADVQPAFRFDVDFPGVRVERPTAETGVRLRRRPTPERPGNLDDLAFASTAELGELIRSRRVSSLELTTMYLNRVKKYD